MFTRRTFLNRAGSTLMTPVTNKFIWFMKEHDTPSVEVPEVQVPALNSNMFEVLEVLLRVRERLSDPARWCKGIGRKIDSFCLAGAVIAEVFRDGDQIIEPKKNADFSDETWDDELVIATLWVLRIVLRDMQGEEWLIQYWNDAPSTSHADVLNLLDRAIEFERSDLLAREMLLRIGFETMPSIPHDENSKTDGVLMETFWRIYGTVGVRQIRDLYIDLDGIILRRTGRIGFRGRVEFEVAPYAMEFLDWCKEYFHCFWLTSRSHDGSHEGIERAFRFALPTTTLPDDWRQMIRSIRPAKWGASKVDGIDLTKNFLWMDDNPDQSSLHALEESGMRDCWIEASTDRRPDDLKRIKRGLKKALQR